MVSGFLGLLFAAAVVAAIAIAAAFLLDKFAGQRSVLGRAIVAGFIAGFAPMSFAIVGVLRVADQIDLFGALIPLAFGGLFLTLVTGFPVAYFYTRNRARERDTAIDPETFA